MCTVLRVLAPLAGLFSIVIKFVLFSRRNSLVNSQLQMRLLDVYEITVYPDLAMNNFLPNNK